MNPALLEKLRGLRGHLQSEIIGQDEAIDSIAPLLQAGELGLASPEHPKASFLFLGPTGVGKTELAKCFTEYLLGKGHLLRMDMSAYQHPESVKQLLDRNSAPWLPWDRLEDREPWTVLWDEIEKAHPAILDLLLQILDTGILTLVDGTSVDFTRHYVVLTSNIASLAICRSRQKGAALERFVRDQAEKHLRPELVARLDGVLVFRRLENEDLLRIRKKFWRAEQARLKQLGLPVSMEMPEVGIASPHNGARGIRREVGSEIRRSVINRILDCGTLTPHDSHGFSDEKVARIG